ncbi:MAG: hypothetical protein KA886_09905, partial [Candidatus Cloacimonetes bacterium]|nr:hypothetical protein [Candidatus Cloacimonadota bacterium]
KRQNQHFCPGNIDRGGLFLIITLIKQSFFKTPKSPVSSILILFFIGSQKELDVISLLVVFDY